MSPTAGTWRGMGRREVEASPEGVGDRGVPVVVMPSELGTPQGQLAESWGHQVGTAVSPRPLARRRMMMVLLLSELGTMVSPGLRGQ